jgi:predicted TIM-barrel fold metal-dependent hydrolase
VIDCDVHPLMRGGLADALKYLTPAWQQRLQPLAKSIECPGVSRDEITAGACLLVPLVRLNAWSDSLMAAAVASACNDYLIDEWIASDPRPKLALLLPSLAPATAVDEIVKHGGRPSVVAATMPLVNLLLGEAHYHPIFAALQDHDLTLVLHPTGAEGLFLGAPALAGGTSFSAAERSILMHQVAQANLCSLILQGTLERFPQLRVVFSGFGFGWLPALLWRMDMDWRRLRIETPWVRQAPTEYVQQHVWFTATDHSELRGKDSIRSPALAALEDRVLYGSHDGAATLDAGARWGVPQLAFPRWEPAPLEPSPPV